MPHFKYEDVSLFYTDEGSGQPILLLHGWAGDGLVWSFQIPTLLQLGLRVIVLDHRGHGRSSSPEDTSAYSFAKIIEDVLALLEHLNTGPVVLMGHSMSTIIGSMLAAEYPEWVKALIVVHPIYSTVPPMTALTQKLHEAPPEEVPQMCKDVFERIMWKPGSPEWLKTWVHRQVLGLAPQAHLGVLVASAEMQWKVTGQSDETKKFMQKRTMPRLVIATTDTAPGWEQDLGVREGIDEVHFLPNGTFTHIIKADEVNEIMANWLKKIEMV